MTDPRRRYALTQAHPGEEDRFFVEALDKTQWRPAGTGPEGDDWDTLWHVGMPPATAFQRARDGRLVNHIPGNGALTVKSSLADHIHRTRDQLAALYGNESEPAQAMDMIPPTYCLPRDRAALEAAAAAEPGALWLLKPANSARGQGIRLLDDPRGIKPPGSPEGGWIVQRYLADPHLIDHRKYVLRLYVLIRSVAPLRVERYAQGFAKLASHAYTLDDLTDPYIHQTNPDINATNARVDDPVVFIDLEGYRARLAAEGQDADGLFRRIDRLIAQAVWAARPTMDRATRAAGADPTCCYEFLGLDCLVDRDRRPWLLECNLNPSLGVFAGPADGGEEEARIKRAMVYDLVDRLGLNDPQRPHQDRPAPAGGFQPLASDIKTLAPPLPRLTPGRVDEHIDDHGLRLYDRQRQRWLQPNDTASLIWLLACDGQGLEAIVDELRELPDADSDRDTLAHTVWSTLAEWTRQGLLDPLA